MDRVVGEAVGRDVLEVEPGVAAQDIEEVAGRAEVQDQAGAPEGEGGSGAAGLGIGALVPALELRADDVVEEVPQPTAAADLGVQVEDLVVTRERSERAELELVGRCATRLENPHVKATPNIASARKARLLR